MADQPKRLAIGSLDELLELLQTQRQPYTTEGNPTEVTNHAWIYALRKQGSYPAKTERSGKWLIFLSAQSIDRYWAKIKEAVEQGQLGEQAKVSTLNKGSMPPEVRRKKEERGDTRFVICVYTYDYADEADVMSVV
ncbi:MAG TPA: putative phosphothreonine lyase domain-containing protein [Ktedonobacteraceae bacterium]|nr:putative phosphothreonine lyase domain-containing protein [Ktedonobacteraceae bacterium]